MNYRAYLKSPLWAKIRRRVLRRDQHRCQSCGGRARQVHHGRYDDATLSGETLEHLFSLCGRCHEAVSFNAYGQKRSMKEQAEWTEVLRKPAKPKQKKRRNRPAVPRVLHCGTYRVT